MHRQSNAVSIAWLSCSKHSGARPRIKLLFYLKRGKPEAEDCLKYVTDRVTNEPNDPNLLYTVFGPAEQNRARLGRILKLLQVVTDLYSGRRSVAVKRSNLSENGEPGFMYLKSGPILWSPCLRIVTAQQFQQLHGHTPLTQVCGFSPERTWPARV